MIDKIGDALPDLTLLSQEGTSISLLEKIGKPLVVYFYPKDFTPGCTLEACSFRDSYNLITTEGAEVIGISGDTPKSHKKFAHRYKLSYLLLSDSERKAEKAFGVARNLFGLLPGRETFIFDASGKLIHKFTSAFNPTKHVDETIKVLKKLSTVKNS